VNLASGPPVSAETTLVRTGSVSKLLTWTAAMQLVEQEVMRRMEKHRAWAAAAVGLVVTLLAALAVAPGPDALPAMVLVMTSFGFFLGLLSIALPALLADIVDYDLWRDPAQRRGSRHAAAVEVPRG
jgi:Na+/melibiose symporter-like transporter